MKIYSYVKTINFSLVYSGEVKPKEGYYFYEHFFHNLSLHFKDLLDIK